MTSLDIDPELLKAFEFAADSLVPRGAVDWKPLPHQIPPAPPWLLWMLFGGRGSGKTAASAKYFFDHINGPPCIPGVPGGHWASIVAPTLGDAVTSCVTGPSGLILHDPGIKVLNRPGGIIAKFSNGVEVKLFGAHSPEDVERFRAGGNRCLCWCEEMAAWRYLEESWQQIRYGLRSGPRPHAIASTTPRPKKLIKDLINDPKVVVTKGNTRSNPYLPEDIKDQLYADYADTRMGRQELEGEILEDVEGALWETGIIDETRTNSNEMPDLNRVAVGVDPSITSSGDECGIIVGGMSWQWPSPHAKRPDLTHGFVLDDVSVQGSPSEWARKAVDAYYKWQADLIIAERNQGGEMVQEVIWGVDENVPVKLVSASKGKQARAQPIANLWYQGRAHMVGSFKKLEDQMVSWDPYDPDHSWSPDRMDAMVWLFSELIIGLSTENTRQMNDKRLSSRR
jgi:phage terminase large subunit-like protein